MEAKGNGTLPFFGRQPDKPLHATDKKVDEDGVLFVQRVYTTTIPAQADTTMHNSILVDTATEDTGIGQRLINKADYPVTEGREIQLYGYYNMIYDYQAS